MKKSRPIAGVACLCQTPNGEIVGDEFRSSRSNMRNRKYIDKMKGEHWGMMLTEVARRYPFPEIEGFVPEGLVWMEMALDYDDYCINEPLRIYHANEPDALSKIRRSAGWWLYHCAVAKRDRRYFWYAPLRITYSFAIAFIFACSSRMRFRSSGRRPNA